MSLFEVRRAVRFRSSLVGSIGVTMLWAGCAAPVNTLAQDLAWKRWEKCSRQVQGPRLVEIRADGQISWFSHGPTETAAMNDCLQQAVAEQVAQVSPAKVDATAPEASTGVETPRPLVVAASAVPVWTRGSEWAFRWESAEGRGIEVWTVDREEVLGGLEYYVVTIGGWGGWESYWRKSDLAFYQDKYAGVVVARYIPPQMIFTWPLMPGKTWEQSYTRESARDPIWQTAMVCEVRGEERIAVPAGVFDTLRIVCRLKGTGALLSEKWYSPEARIWVRVRGRFPHGILERELIAMKLK